MATEDKPLVGIHGWLLFFVLTMILFSPLRDAVYLTEHLDTFNQPFALFTMVLVHGLGFYSVLLLYRGKAKGISVAKFRLWVYMALGAITLVGSISAGKFPEGFELVSYGVVWMAYLHSSKRVKNTYFPTTELPVVLAPLPLPSQTYWGSYKEWITFWYSLWLTILLTKGSAVFGLINYLRKGAYPEALGFAIGTVIVVGAIMFVVAGIRYIYWTGNKGMRLP